MPNPARPHRNIHAKLRFGDHSDLGRPIPVQPGRGAPADRTTFGAGTAGIFGMIAPGTDASVVAARRLDRGRLCAQEIIAATDWGPGLALCADVSRTGRVLLTVAAPAPTGPQKLADVVVGTHTAHTDSRGMIVISGGLRKFLGVESDGQVIARVSNDGTAVEILTADVLDRALAMLDGIDAFIATNAAAAAAAVTGTVESSTNNHTEMRTL